MNVVWERRDEDSYNVFDYNNNCLGRGVIALYRSKAFQILTLSYLCTFFHEFGHAVAFKMVRGGTVTIHMHEDGGGLTTCSKKKSANKLKEIWISLSGPLAGSLYGVALVIGIFALTHFVSMPLGLSISLRVWVSLIGTYTLLKELVYAIASALKKDNGDLGSIRNEGGNLHCVVALTLLVAIWALGIYGAIALL